tara:strand:- start:523 stop:624 length:102 start_codon:yes stop_codon:yes gene_type:complete
LQVAVAEEQAIHLQVTQVAVVVQVVLFTDQHSR